ncbi:hypothetical protein [Candidatus Sororendozoicomonas aggregata]|uniref:hypothetical protein n=1 Tax=Candidatus Sororendozoicomonas aggregata TaxID=3073239 RepID=UPI002ED574E4
MFAKTGDFTINGPDLAMANVERTQQETSFIITAVWLTTIRNDLSKTLHKETPTPLHAFTRQHDGKLYPCTNPELNVDKAQKDGLLRMQLVTSKIPRLLFAPSPIAGVEKKPLYSSGAGLSLQALAFFRTIGVGGCKDIAFNTPCMQTIAFISGMYDEGGRGLIYTFHLNNENFYNFGIYTKGDAVYLFLPTSGEYMCEALFDCGELEWNLHDTLARSLDAQWDSEFHSHPDLKQATCDIKEIIFS